MFLAEGAGGGAVLGTRGAGTVLRGHSRAADGDGSVRVTITSSVVSALLLILLLL